jgi:hypothetical protein
VPVSVTIGRPGQFREFERYAAERFEAATLRATARAARQATGEVRTAMRGAGLGKLANAIGQGSDLAKEGRAHRRAGSAFSASGWIYVRGQSERTEGALESYTEGAEIRPKRGTWLAIATPMIGKRAGRRKMTPALYRSSGLEQKIGPLEFIPGRNRNEALLVARGPLTVDRFGRGRARRLGKSGRHSANRERRDFVVAFVLIRQTSRAARVDPRSIIAANASRLPSLLGEELRKEISHGR